MTSKCEYCDGVHAEKATKCQNCGAPVTLAEAPDYRFCPHCRRRLLSLGSPACSMCGQVLPGDYLRAREAHLRRVVDVSSGTKDASTTRQTGDWTFEDSDDSASGIIDRLFNSSLFRSKS